ncbi:MAG: hypothetical protein PHO62_05140 [Sulfurimonas sp.]|nr:hypothetical protein [Sulfurimonas sp.]MDD5372792.1 hypothetical protein [Sulfurimonas sp.]
MDTRFLDDATLDKYSYTLNNSGCEISSNSTVAMGRRGLVGMGE